MCWKKQIRIQMSDHLSGTPTKISLCSSSLTYVLPKAILYCLFPFLEQRSNRRFGAANRLLAEMSHSPLASPLELRFTNAGPICSGIDEKMDKLFAPMWRWIHARRFIYCRGYTSCSTEGIRSFMSGEMLRRVNQMQSIEHLEITDQRWSTTDPPRTSYLNRLTQLTHLRFIEKTSTPSTLSILQIDSSLSTLPLVRLHLDMFGIRLNEYPKDGIPLFPPTLTDLTLESTCTLFTSTQWHMDWIRQCPLLRTLTINFPIRSVEMMECMNQLPSSLESLVVYQYSETEVISPPQLPSLKRLCLNPPFHDFKSVPISWTPSLTPRFHPSWAISMSNLTSLHISVILIEMINNIKSPFLGMMQLTSLSIGDVDKTHLSMYLSRTRSPLRLLSLYNIRFSTHHIDPPHPDNDPDEDHMMTEMKGGMLSYLLCVPSLTTIRFNANIDHCFSRLFQEKANISQIKALSFRNNPITLHQMRFILSTFPQLTVFDVDNMTQTSLNYILMNARKLRSLILLHTTIEPSELLKVMNVLRAPLQHIFLGLLGHAKDMIENKSVRLVLMKKGISIVKDHKLHFESIFSV